MGQTLIHPTKGPSTVFAFLFLVSGIFHIWQSRRYHSWPYTWPLPVACILMTAGFICREYSAFRPDGEDMSSAIEGLFYSATQVFTFPLYLFLMRLLSTRSNRTRVGPRYFFIAFSCFNSAIITCMSQGVSQYFSPSAPSYSDSSSRALVQASLLLQLAFNAAQIGILIYFQHEMIDRSADKTTSKICSILYLLMTYIVVCNIFRTVQIFVAPFSTLWVGEVYFWVFEALMSLGYTVSFHVIHPAKYLVAMCEAQD